MNTPDFIQGRYIVGFDLGGTLLDESAPQLSAISEEILSKTDIDEKTLSQFLMYTIDQLMKENSRIANDQISSSSILEKALEKFNLNIPVEILEEITWLMMGGAETSYLTPFSKTLETLRELKENGATIVALSNTALPIGILNRLLERHGLLSYFDEVVLSSECGWRKPDLNAFKALEKTIEISPEDFVVYIGNDYEADILPASILGYKTVYIGTNNLALNSVPSPTLSVAKLDDLMEQLPHRNSALWN